MRFRKLRIAFSITCGIACVLLVALWVRSYWWMDQIYGHTSAKSLLHFGSMRGQITLRRIRNYEGAGIPRNWLPESESVSSIMQRRQRNFPNGQGDLLVYRFNSRTGWGLLSDGFYLPHWILAALFGMFVVVSLGKPAKRFSLRTLLFALTFIAFTLGLIGILVRRH